MSTDIGVKEDLVVVDEKVLDEENMDVETADEVGALPLFTEVPPSPSRLDSDNDNALRRTSVMFAGERHHRGSVTANITNRLACEEALLDKRLQETLREDDDKAKTTERQETKETHKEHDAASNDADKIPLNPRLERKRSMNSSNSLVMSETNMDLEDLAAELAQAENEYLLSMTSSDEQDAQFPIILNAKPSTDPLAETIRMHVKAEEEFLQQDAQNKGVAGRHNSNEQTEHIQHDSKKGARKEGPEESQEVTSSMSQKRVTGETNLREESQAKSNTRESLSCGNRATHSSTQLADQAPARASASNRPYQLPLSERRWLVLGSGAMAGAIAGLVVKGSAKSLVPQGLSVVLMASAGLTYASQNALR